MKCHICNSPSAYLLKQTILKKHPVSYFKCTSCNFIQTEEPFWLQEAYSKAIAQTDIGLVSRNIYLSKVIHAIISGFFDSDGKFIDYGAGYGLLVRLMRDRGFNFFHYDKNCVNLFSNHFPAKMDPGKKYELLTAIEVFEHLQKPIDEIKKMLSYSDNILFTTLLVPCHANPSNDWWYFTPQTGQHISFYSLNSLRLIAKHFNLSLSSNFKNVHLLSARAINNHRFRLYCNYVAAYAISTLKRRRSLQNDDYQYALKSN